MNAFISYGDASDQITALRLQALGAVNGLTVYVPPADTRQNSEALSNAESQQKLRDAEVVLGVVGSGLTEACRQELNAALTLKKNMIVMTSPGLAAQLEPYFGPNIVEIDPANPGGAEMGLMGYLNNIDAQQSAKTALLALGTLTLGLLLLAPANRS